MALNGLLLTRLDDPSERLLLCHTELLVAQRVDIGALCIVQDKLLPLGCSLLELHVLDLLGAQSFGPVLLEDRL